MAAHLLLGQAAWAANTEQTVNTNATDLTASASYTPTGAPTTTSDVTFGTSTYTTTTFTVGSSLSIGTLDDLSSQALIIDSPTTADTLTLNGGSNSVSGTPGDLIYVASGGSLTIQNTPKTLGVALASSGNFDVMGALTINSILSGAGFTITETGSGILTLAGANTFSGGLTIDSGTVSGSAAASLGTGTVILGNSSGSNSATLINTGSGITQANAVTVASGSTGTLTIEGSGNSNTFSGAIALNNNLTVDNVTSGKTTTFSGAITEGTSAVTLTKGTGAGTVTLSNGIVLGSGGLTIDNSGATTLAESGVISGTGSLTIQSTGTGGVTLSKANTFTGAVDLNSGLLTIGNTTALGSSSNLLTIAGGTLDATGSFTEANAVNVTGNFNYGGTGALTFTGAYSMNVSNLTISDATSTDRGLTFDGTTGSSSIGGGTFTLQATSTLVTTTEIALVSLGLSTVDNSFITNLTGNETFNLINGSGGVLAELFIAGLNDGGNGYGFTKNGNGELLVGSNGNALSSYSGPVILNAGGLVIGSPSALGTGMVTLNGGAFGSGDSSGGGATFTNAITFTAGDTIDVLNAGSAGETFSGSISLGNAASIILYDPYSATNKGGFNISGAMEIGGTNGNINFSIANLTVGGDITLSGVISDGGTNDSVTILSETAGDYVSISNAANTFDGGLVLDGGSLKITPTATVVANVITQGAAGTGTLFLNGGSIAFSANGTLPNPVAINGTVEFGGSTANALPNGSYTDTYSGATTIAGGSVLTSPTATGYNQIIFSNTVALLGNASVQPAFGSFFALNNVTGTGGLTIGSGTSTGTVTLTGTNTYSGPTAVSSGTLSVTGILTNSAVTVGNGATLLGTGTIDAMTTVSAGGILVAGDGVYATASLTLAGGVNTSASSSVIQFVIGGANISNLALSSSSSNTFGSNQIIDFANIATGTYDNLITGLASDPGTEGSWVLDGNDPTDAGFSANFFYSNGAIDVTIGTSAVPEPADWLLLSLGLLSLGICRFRSRLSGNFAS